MTCRELITELQKINDLDKEVRVLTNFVINDNKILKTYIHI